MNMIWDIPIQPPQMVTDGLIQEQNAPTNAIIRVIFTVNFFSLITQVQHIKAVMRGVFLFSFP